MLIQYASTRAPMVPVTPTAQQLRDHDVTLTWAIFNQPFFAHLLMAEIPIVWTRNVPIAATDGFCLFLNPDQYFCYSMQERAFILFHEIMHCIFGDTIMHQAWLAAGQIFVNNEWLPYSGDLMNIAQDLVINAILITGNAGKFNTDWLYDTKITRDGNIAAVEVYAKLYKQAVQTMKAGKMNFGPSSSGAGGIMIPLPYDPKQRFDDHLAPGAKNAEQPEDVIKGHNKARWQAAIQSAATVAQQQGKLPEGIRRLVEGVLNPKVSWQEHLRASCSRANGAEGLDWRYADRRMITRSYVGAHDPIYFARAAGHSAGTVVIGVDTSGSIGPSQLEQFFGEMTGILNDMAPERVVVIQCDCAVGAVDEITDIAELDEWRARGLKGGGGTDFNPVFDEIKSLGLQPDFLVYLTDLYGDFPPKEPDYPVIWGVIGACRKVPFGDLVPIEV